MGHHDDSPLSGGAARDEATFAEEMGKSSGSLDPPIVNLEREPISFDISCVTNEE